MGVPTRTLVLGGARSGKSGHAESLAVLEPVRYLATGRRDTTDEDWQRRIDLHRASRPNHWSTVETVTSLAGVISQPWDGTTVVDDLGTWLTGMLDDAQAWELPRGTVAPAVDDLVGAVTRCTSPLVLVSPEVGLSVVPESRSGRLFRDELGSLNSRLATVCDRVLLVVAGLALTLKEPPADFTTAKGTV
ncbi:bifunctional adenosylcobinamide kinase/adenosylcobinamide-phosphate guanylyltransferase [Rhodococcus sp. 15-725-2-2b]|uniref:bifunctional adenosylcobinamide kinase/adenosylcobinamide-phosphate guanylyltransferase n=1 Tax=unclassified Rhodococcus (in: high G+C Gram-positive bacteria) TaxID=192944 RepID=UPI000B9ADC70|nr:MULTISPECIES: bifunctional adenosylcobinamide kinase/adenosylcobinamide-phosphate guanylyltransferase [unclassified Rhodococcus (in: high G+C Gram-positive bacteria)]OZC64861.1 bifunctional adenosylcobinamide kinase/adenosylcobinamide-phosphate guanylyltransferase [Rhodococcus sp. 06-469-3-2]OZD46637.1 bifunctional adenosylcobinamide kinase/adenosylcobinamide-phosphate guanylyltransferase [Rhodococcus sp. 06-1477-1A]OZE04084.1 bifunctional adenosylcobinamide kinase/adenosylcobinamide-phosphat